jgi:hypothetical protein
MPELSLDNQVQSAAMSGRRLLWVCFLALGLGLLAAPVAKLLIDLIHFFTQLFFYGRFSTQEI